MIFVTKENAKIGLKVKISPYLSWSNQDRDSNYGTILSSPEYYPQLKECNWVKVEWENGDRYSYNLSKHLVMYEEKTNIELIAL